MRRSQPGQVKEQPESKNRLCKGPEVGKEQKAVHQWPDVSVTGKAQQNGMQGGSGMKVCVGRGGWGMVQERSLVRCAGPGFLILSLLSNCHILSLSRRQ